MDLLSTIQAFHLIRPLWLLALFPLALIIWLLTKTHANSRSWSSVIDRRLLPHLLQGSNTAKKPLPSLSLFLLGSLVVFALAGPAFEKRPQPVFKAQSALVILLDLSRSMDATDIKPSRLIRARFKIDDILKRRKEGQTALIAYAADAYVVTPLTDDTNTIASQVPALDTSIMPAQGSRLDIALQKAEELFINAGQSKGNIFIITDSINPSALPRIKSLKNKGFSSSILAVGTQEGAPIAQRGGGFVKDNTGAIVIPTLNLTQLRTAALSGGGKFSQLSPTDQDINTLLSIIDLSNAQHKKEQTDADGNKFKTDIWHEEGPFLLLLLIPFAAYAFRKGLVFALLVFILPIPQPAQASAWSDLWNNKDQQGEIALQNNNAPAAVELFEDPEWKAAAQYKAGEYQQAAELLNEFDTAESQYNLGNALAKLGDFEGAIAAYNRSLKLQPNNEDAAYNKKLVEQAQKKKQEQEKQNNEKNQKNNDKKDSEQNDDQSDQNNSDKQDGDQSKQQGDENKSDKNKQNQQGQSEQEKNGEQSDKQSADSQQQKDNEKNKDQQEKSAQNSDKKNEDENKDKQAGKESEKKDDGENSDEKRAARQQELREATPDLEQQQTQQWLKKIPDNPGGLLRRKFKYQYSREQHQNEQKPW